MTLDGSVSRHTTIMVLFLPSCGSFQRNLLFLEMENGLFQSRRFLLVILVGLNVLVCGAAAASGIAKWADSLEEPTVDLLPTDQSNCAALLVRYKNHKQPTTTPPRRMPEEQEAAFTMGGKVATGDMFVDDTIGGKGSHYQFPNADIKYMIQSASDLLKPGSRGRRRLPPMDPWLFSALDEHSILDGHVAVFGNQTPIYKGKKITKRYIWSHFTEDILENLYSKIEDRHFLHNAFCFYKKQTLLDNPFDETLQGKEDRYWAIDMIDKGYSYLYDGFYSKCNHFYTQGGATWKGIG